MPGHWTQYQEVATCSESLSPQSCLQCHFRCASTSRTYPGQSVGCDSDTIGFPFCQPLWHSKPSQSVKMTLWLTWWPTWRWTRWLTWRWTWWLFDLKLTQLAHLLRFCKSISPSSSMNLSPTLLPLQGGWAHKRRACTSVWLDDPSNNQNSALKYLKSVTPWTIISSMWSTLPTEFVALHTYRPPSLYVT